MCMCMCIYIYIYIHTHIRGPLQEDPAGRVLQLRAGGRQAKRLTTQSKHKTIIGVRHSKQNKHK